MGDYRLAPAAERDLEEIWRYGRDQWGADQADRYADQLIGAFEALARSPHTAPACDHIRRGYRRHMVGRHVIYLRLSDQGIVVVRILHDRMDSSRHV
jgi:toxin ParE1/3/4